MTRYQSIQTKIPDTDLKVAASKAYSSSHRRWGRPNPAAQFTNMQFKPLSQCSTVRQSAIGFSYVGQSIPVVHLTCAPTTCTWFVHSSRALTWCIYITQLVRALQSVLLDWCSLQAVQWCWAILHFFYNFINLDAVPITWEQILTKDLRNIDHISAKCCGNDQHFS